MLSYCLKCREKMQKLKIRIKKTKNDEKDEKRKNNAVFKICSR